MVTQNNTLICALYVLINNQYACLLIVRIGPKKKMLPNRFLQKMLSQKDTFANTILHSSVDWENRFDNTLFLGPILTITSMHITHILVLY